jgi:purine-cytosine permease-like protein
MNTSLYVGPLAKAWGRADVSWIIGALLPGGLYYVVASRMLKLGQRVRIERQSAERDQAKVA